MSELLLPTQVLVLLIVWVILSVNQDRQAWIWLSQQVRNVREYALRPPMPERPDPR
jgi:hypothetical protein